MIYEIFAFLGIIATLLMAASVFGKVTYTGMFASTLVLFLSFWILSEGISYPTGQTISLSQASNIICSNESINITNSSCCCVNKLSELSSTSTSINNYQNITWPFESIIAFKYFMFIFLFFLGIAGLLGSILQMNIARQ